MSGISLVFAGRTAEIKKFTSVSLPRTYIDIPQINRSAFGTPNRTGFAYESPHVWIVAAIIDDATKLTLQIQQNRWNQSPAAWLIYDYTEKYAEEAPRTRALAPTASQETNGDDVLYYAQFNGEPQSAFTFTEHGLAWAFQGSFIETTKVVAV